MTIRGKLNSIMALLIVVFAVTASLAYRAAREYRWYVREQTRALEHPDLAAGIQVAVLKHRQALYESGAAAAPSGPGWLSHAQRDIDTQVHSARSDTERRLWTDVRAALGTLAELSTTSPDTPGVKEAFETVDRRLTSIRKHYRTAELDTVAAADTQSLVAQQAILIAGGLIALLFLLYVILVREALVKPVELLKRAADEIGAGQLHPRIPLTGENELAQLARRLESMAQHLADHQEALLKSRELSAIGELCTSVAHGLRNPLAAMRHAVDPAKHDQADHRHLDAALRSILHQVDRMEDRIAKLFEFSRPKEMHLDSATFRQIAHTAQAHVRELLEQLGVKLVIDDQTAGASVRVDRDDLAGALAELIMNAARHTARGADVTVRGERWTDDKDARGGLRLVVSDPGAGMSPAEVDKAFNIFYTTRADGTGMGLAIVRRSVERHGGRMTLESNVGEGTTVTITVPDAGSERAVDRA